MRLGRIHTPWLGTPPSMVLLSLLSHLTPLLLLHMDIFLRAFLRNSTYSSNPPHAPPCSHIVCNMYGACGSLWLGILCSSDTVTSCGLPNMPGILSVFYTSCIAFFLLLFCLFFKDFWPNTTVPFNSELFILWKTSLLIPKLQAETFLPWASFLCPHGNSLYTIYYSL